MILRIWFKWLYTGLLARKRYFRVEGLYFLLKTCTQRKYYSLLHHNHRNWYCVSLYGGWVFGKSYGHESHRSARESGVDRGLTRNTKTLLNLFFSLIQNGRQQLDNSKGFWAWLHKQRKKENNFFLKKWVHNENNNESFVIKTKAKP